MRDVPNKIVPHPRFSTEVAPPLSPPPPHRSPPPHTYPVCFSTTLSLLVVFFTNWIYESTFALFDACKFIMENLTLASSNNPWRRLLFLSICVLRSGYFPRLFMLSYHSPYILFLAVFFKPQSFFLSVGMLSSITFDFFFDRGSFFPPLPYVSILTFFFTRLVDRVEPKLY